MGQATVFEEHASVLPHWWAAGLRDATVVCLDAHLDVQFIAPERIAKLRACGDAGALARLQSPHPLSPCRHAAFGIEDFLYAAAQLGVLRRLVWVAPPHVLRDGAAAVQALRQMEGVTPQQLASFHRVPGGWIEGELLGLELVVLELPQLAALPLQGEVAVDIDADYFVEVPQDRLWIAPQEVVARLRQRLGNGLPLSIARSVGSGFLPLRHRFLADALAALWEGRGEDAGYWQRLLEAQGDGAQEEQVQALEALAGERPGCAAAWHALGLATAEPVARARHLAQAAAIDPAWGDDALRELGFLRPRPQSVDLARVLRLRRRLETAQVPPAHAGAAWVALGLHYAALDRLEDAVDCDECSLAHGGGHPDLALQIGRLIMASGGTDDALPWLERAAADDETRVAAWLHLSVCASRRGHADEAHRWARVACEAAPAWQEAARWRDSLGDCSG